MRDRYLSDSRQPARRPLIVATIAVLTLFIGDMVTRGALRSEVRAHVGAAWQAVMPSTPAFADGPDSMTSLKNEVEELRSEHNQWLAAADENASLKALVKLAKETPGIAAPVLSPTDTNPFGTFVIGAGAAEGIKTGATVIAPDGFVIGRIVEADEHTSLTEELFAPDQKTPATLVSSAIELEGRGAGNAHGQIPREASTTPGEVVRSAVVGNRPIGVVGAIVPDPGNAFQEVYVRVPDAIQALRIVYVIP